MPSKKVRPIELVKISDMIPNEWNPNTESPEKFNLLVESIEDIGFAENVIVVPITEGPQKGKFKIVGGEHRWRAAKIAEIDELPAVILEGIDEDKQKALTVRMNLLKGEIDPLKFTQLYEELANKGYSEQMLRDMMGIASRNELNRFLKEIKEQLPKDMQDALEKSKAEIKTVDDLALVLNRLFRKHGNVLDKSYMVFDWGGKVHTWIRLKRKTHALVEQLKNKCMEENVDINEFLCVGMEHVIKLQKEWPESEAEDLGIEKSE